MTKEITRAKILQEITDKFELREWEKDKFLFSETVVPTYDISDHARHPELKHVEMSITAAPTAYLFFTVPENERWFLHAYNVIFMASGAYKVTGLYVTRKAGASGAWIYLDMTLAQTVSYRVVLPKDVLLDPGDRLYVYVDDYTSTANLRLYIDYTREDIR